jgi:signal transduction histidine kinase
MVSSLKLNQVLNTTISRISELIRFDHGLIYLLNTRTGEAEVGAVSGEGAGQATDLTLRPGTPAMQLWEQAQAGGVALACSSDRCMMMVPLANRGNMLGCILLARSPGQPFLEMECEIAEQLAGAAAAAVDNARLFSSLSQQQQHTAALYRLMLKVSDAPNRRQLAHVVCQEIQQITGARASALLIHDAEQGRFTGWATSGEWADRREVHSVALAAHGDPFVSNVLALMHQRDTPDLLLIHDVPVQARHMFGGESSITLPLTLAGRIYGLLILKPDSDPAIPDDLRETVNLAVSHCTVALERTELFEQTLAAARQSGMLHSTASEVQASLDPAMVVQTTANGVLLALPIQSCEIYILDSGRKRLRREARAVARGQEAHWAMGPDQVPAEENPIVLEVLHSSGLVASDFSDDVSTVAERSGPTVLLGRLMGSEEALGVVRLTTTLPAEEFVRRHATFCQTLWMHSGGALERSRLYTTTSTQARKLRQRAQQLTDILRLGSLSAADVPLTTLLPHIATGIARSLGFATVQIGELAADRRVPGSRGPRGLVWPGLPGMPSQPLRLDVLDELMAVGQPVHSDFKGVYLDEVKLVRIACNEPEPPPGTPSRQLLLLPLESSSGGTIGYLLAAPRSDLGDPALDNEQLEILRIFAQRVALTIENHLVYSELLTNKGKIESVVLSISDGVVVTDHELNVVITNSLADQLLGMEPGASRALPLRQMLPNEALIAQLEDCLTTGQSTSADVELLLGREQRTYEAVVHRMGSPEVAESLGLVLTLRDVTLERATERAKSDFLSIVSHELRTPLNSVMGFLDIVLMGKTGPLTDIQADFLGTAKQESVALQRLINDVLDYSQLQSRMLRVETVPMDLSSVMTRVVNNSRLRMADDQLRVVNNVPPQILVMGDEVRLEQVFKNLLDNAAKFTDPGGEIRFEATLTDDTVTISVVDTGCGIPPAQVGNVFDRFYQAENNSNRHKRGLGLGLAICKNIVEAHEGEIWIDSTLGVGTTVHVKLQLFHPELYDLDLNTGTASAKARH